MFPVICMGITLKYSVEYKKVPTRAFIRDAKRIGCGRRHHQVRIKVGILVFSMYIF